MKAWIIVFLGLGPVSGEVLRVPSEHASIQLALNATNDGDTVLVSLGVYAEALIGPSHTFLLKGDVMPDTGQYPRPVVDPSILPNPRSQRCLVLGPNGHPIVEDILFRNGPEMYPRLQSGESGGVVNFSPLLEIRNCVFDSVYIGVKSDVRTSLVNCTFVDNIFACVDIGQSQLSAVDCMFDGMSGGWGMIESGRHSLLERCRITDRGVGQTVYWHHADSSVIRDCVFFDLPGMTATPVLLSGDSCKLERCVFVNCVIHSPLVTVRNNCDVPSEVRDCEFRDNYVNDEWSWSSSHCLAVALSTDESGCEQNIVVNCVFRDGTRERGGAGIYVEDPAAILHNRFARLNGSEFGVCTFSGGPSLMRDNQIYECEFAATTDLRYLISAEHNWWGCETGPHHPQLNPLGQGVRVGDNIQFIPWYTDTLFFSDSPELRPPLPESASILAYPNPFNSVATIELTVPRAMIARIELFDVTGRRVRELWSGAVADEKTVTWQASEFASGLYFVRAWDPLGNRPLALAKVALLR